MTTLRDRPDPGTGGDEPTGYEAAHCPHCGDLMWTGVALPWPAEPVLCSSCERWVGRARALPAGAEPASESDADRHDETLAARDSAERRSHRRRRPSRPAPAERRRARELGPPPVPRFGAPEPEPEADLDLQDDAFAVTGAWDAPAAPHDSNGSSQPAVDHLGAEPAPSVEPWAAPPDETNGAVGSPADIDEGEAAPVAEPPIELTHDGSSWAGEHEDDDDLGPPAPFYAPAAPAEALNGSTPPAETDALDAEVPAAEPVEPSRSLPAGSGTLPFWSVPSEPPKPKRRLSLKHLRPRLRRPRFGRPTRAGLMRALPKVLIVVGVLLVLEVALTVLWKDPFTAIFAAQSQSALDGDLDALERQNAAEADAARDQKALTRLQRRRSVTLNRDTAVTKPIGRLRIDKIDLSEVVVQGTDEETSLTKGPGHYTETPLPGQKGNWTVGIAGHRTTYGAPFRNINKLKKGDDIVFSVPYGRFTYEVAETKIVDASYQKAFVPKGDDQIVLTACHPLYSAAQRILVYGKLTKSEPRGGARAAAKLRP